MKRTVIAGLLGMVMLAVNAGAQDAPGRWEVEKQTSALTDTVDVSYSLCADNEQPNSIDRPERPVLLLGCKSGEAVLVVSFNDYMGSDSVDVQYRIDHGKIVSIVAAPSLNGRAFGFWGDAAVSFAKMLRGKKKIVIAAAPYNSGLREGVFTLEGIETVFADVAEICHWATNQ